MGLFNKDKWVQVIVCGNCGYISKISEVKKTSYGVKACQACDHPLYFSRGGSEIKYAKKNKQGIWYFRDDS